MKMNEQKIKIYGGNDEVLSKIKNELNILIEMLNSTHLSHCVMTFDTGVVAYVYRNKNNICVCLEEENITKEMEEKKEQ